MAGLTIWIIAAVLAALGFVVPLIGPSLGLDSTITGTFSGALIGAAAAVFAAKLERVQNEADEQTIATSRSHKVKALIAAELVNVAAGLIDTKQLLQSAVATVEAGRPLPEQIDLSASLPRSMPFTA